MGCKADWLVPLIRAGQRQRERRRRPWKSVGIKLSVGYIRDVAGPAGLIKLLEVAVDQHGFVTPDSARSVGVDPVQLPIMLSRGQLARWGRGLYRIPQLPITDRTELAGAVLLVGHDAVISHESALALNEVSDVNPSRIHVTVPASRRVRRSGLERVVVWRADLDPDDVTVVDGIRSTTLWRTIRDCHAAGTDPGLLRQAVKGGAERGLLVTRERDAALELVAEERP